MGSNLSTIGVSTGRVTQTQASDILDGRVVPSTRVGTIVVFPNNFESIGILRSGTLNNNNRGFAISMANATAEQRQAFLTAARGRLNVDNSERAAQRAYNAAKAAGATDTEARIAQEAARTATQRNLLQGMLDRDKASGRNRFGNIKLRNLTRRDYQKVG